MNPFNVMHFAITGAIKGTSREKIYSKLGLQSLKDRFGTENYVSFYKILNSISPRYLSDIIRSTTRRHSSRNAMRQSEILFITAFTVPTFQFHEIPFSIKSELLTDSLLIKTKSKLFKPSFYGNPTCSVNDNKLILDLSIK